MAPRWCKGVPEAERGHAVLMKRKQCGRAKGSGKSFSGIAILENYSRTFFTSAKCDSTVGPISSLVDLV